MDNTRKLKRMKREVQPLARARRGPIQLDEDQKRALALIMEGKSIFLTGQAGTGKSVLIRTFTREMRTQGKQVAVTATTGAAAVLVGGTTLHHWAGVGLGQRPAAAMARSVRNSWPEARKRWRSVHVLVVDEAPMLNPDLFDKLEQMARILRDDDRPFGGVQLVITGDFAQLQCPDSPDRTIRDTPAWRACIQHTVELTTIHRQDDPVFQKCLSEIRLVRNGQQLSQQTQDLLRSRVGVELKNAHGVRPTRLYSHRRSVEEVNERELKALDAEIHEFPMKTRPLQENVGASTIEKHKKQCLAMETLQLAEGAQVMLICNKDVEGGLVNGSRGVVESFDEKDGYPRVRFANGQTEWIGPHTWRIECQGKNVLDIVQVPLILGYALTIHKAQGVTLQLAQINIGPRVFAPGQAYVALSRVQNLQSLCIEELCLSAIRAPKAVLY